MLEPSDQLIGCGHRLCLPPRPHRLVDSLHLPEVEEGDLSPRDSLKEQKSGCSGSPSTPEGPSNLQSSPVMRKEREGSNSVVWYSPAGSTARSYLGNGCPLACWCSAPPPPQALTVRARLTNPSMKAYFIAQPPHL